MYGNPGSFVAPTVPYDARVPMNIPKNVIRVNEQAVWSTRRYLSGSILSGSNEAVFQVGQGSIGQGFNTQLTIAETSLSENSRISNARSFLADAIAIHLYYEGGTAPGMFPVSSADLLNYQAHCVPAWKFLQTTIEIGSGILIGSGGGVFGSTADQALAYGVGGSGVALNNGAGNVWIYRKNPVMLPGGTNFNMILFFGGDSPVVDGGTNDGNLCIKVSLLGKYETAVPQG